MGDQDNNALYGDLSFNPDTTPQPALFLDPSDTQEPSNPHPSGVTEPEISATKCILCDGPLFRSSEYNEPIWWHEQPYKKTNRCQCEFVYICCGDQQNPHPPQQLLSDGSNKGRKRWKSCPTCKKRPRPLKIPPRESAPSHADERGPPPSASATPSSNGHASGETVQREMTDGSRQQDDGIIECEADMFGHIIKPEYCGSDMPFIYTLPADPENAVPITSDRFSIWTIGGHEAIKIDKRNVPEDMMLIERTECARTILVIEKSQFTAFCQKRMGVFVGNIPSQKIGKLGAWMAYAVDKSVKFIKTGTDLPGTAPTEKVEILFVVNNVHYNKKSFRWQVISQVKYKHREKLEDLSALQFALDTIRVSSYNRRVSAAVTKIDDNNVHHLSLRGPTDSEVSSASESIRNSPQIDRDSFEVVVEPTRHRSSGCIPIYNECNRWHCYCGRFVKEGPKYM